MGTRFEFVLAGECESRLRAAGEEALAEIEYLHEKFSSFSRSSIVTRINERASSEPVGLDRETFELLALCAEVWRASEGAFDITIAPLMRTFGFRAGKDGPDCVVGMEHIALDEAACTVRFLQPGVEIDLGAVAKGYALDRAATILRESGVRCALLHGGTSTIVAVGSPPDAAGWGVEVHDEEEPLRVTLRDEAMSVSAPRGRMIERGGEAIGHVIDPRVKSPARGAICAAVIGPSAAEADAWSTALLVLNHRPAPMPAAIASMICDAARGWRCAGPCTPSRSASRRG